MPTIETYRKQAKRLQDIKLRTAFVSDQERTAWLPRELWRVHKITFRLVVQKGGKYYATEVPDTD